MLPMELSKRHAIGALGCVVVLGLGLGLGLWLGLRPRGGDPPGTALIATETAQLAAAMCSMEVLADLSCTSIVAFYGVNERGMSIPEARRVMIEKRAEYRAQIDATIASTLDESCPDPALPASVLDAAFDEEQPADANATPQPDVSHVDMSGYEVLARIWDTCVEGVPQCWAAFEDEQNERECTDALAEVAPKLPTHMAGPGARRRHLATVQAPWLWSQS